MILTRKQALIPSATLMLILLGYVALVWPALSGPFVFDDFPNLQNLELLGNDVRGNLGHYLASFIGNPGRPIAALSFLINDSAWPSDPFSFKYTNLMIHLLNGVLLFGLLRQLAKANPALPQSPFWPLLAMAAWLFHPLQLSAQMLVVQRMALLSATFCFIGLWGYTALLQRAKSLLGDFTALCVLGTCTILAFLCKENGALLPIYALALNVTLLQKVMDDKTLASKRLIHMSCVAPSLLVLGAIAYMGAKDTFPNREFNIMERVMTQMHVLADYLRHILMPRLSGSGIYFDDYPVTRSWTQPISTLLLAIGFAASLLFAIAKRRRFPILSFAILWFFAGHAMESSVLNLELFFEHRNYIPLLGPVMALSIWALRLGRNRNLGAPLFLLWLLLLSSITTLQAPIWGNAGMMTTIWAKEHPMSLRAIQDLAKYRYENGQRQVALDGLMQAYDSGIKYADLPFTGLLAECWNPGIHADRNLYQESFRSAASSIYSNSVLVSLSLLREAAQKKNCPNLIDENRWISLSEQLLYNPKFLLNSEGYIRVERAKLFIHQRNLEKTMLELEKAYEITPSVALTQKIAEVLLSAGLFDEARQWLLKGLSLKEPWPEKWLYSDKKKSEKILAELEKINISESSNSQKEKE